MIICCVVVTPILPLVWVVIVRSSEEEVSVSPVSEIVSELEDVVVLDPSSEPVEDPDVTFFVVSAKATEL